MPAPNPDHYAIVVGISKYPAFGATSKDAKDLDAPINDALEVYEWLVHPEGGGLDPDNVSKITSPPSVGTPWDRNTATPKFSEVLQGFECHVISGSSSTRNPPCGRRLYIYASGHGFAPRRAQGALITAEAASPTFNNLFISACLDWLYNAAYFEEFILWMDCCMNYFLTPTPGTPSWPVRSGNSQNCKVFCAYSAQWKLESVEDVMPDGKCHGVFTYTLLKGLNSAIDDQGRVTTRSLKDYLINNMRLNITPKYRSSGTVSKEPDFGNVDDIVLVPRAPSPPLFTLQIPGVPDGTQVDILGGNPSRIVATEVVIAGNITSRLIGGNYIAVIVSTATQIPFTV
jgi:hypothetical protein